MRHLSQLLDSRFLSASNRILAANWNRPRFPDSSRWANRAIFLLYRGPGFCSAMAVAWQLRFRWYRTDIFSNRQVPNPITVKAHLFVYSRRWRETGGGVRCTQVDSWNAGLMANNLTGYYVFMRATRYCFWLLAFVRPLQMAWIKRCDWWLEGDDVTSFRWAVPAKCLLDIRLISFYDGLFERERGEAVLMMSSESGSLCVAFRYRCH